MELTAEEIEWLTALRSGNFDQGTEYLNRGGRYCCLGVRCELDLRRDPSLFAEIVIEGGKVEYASGHDQLPDAETFDRWNLKPSIGEELAELNDQFFTFENIADKFEAWVAAGRPENWDWQEDAEFDY